MPLVERIFAFWIVILSPQLCLAIGNRPTLAHVNSPGTKNLHGTDSFGKQEQGVPKGSAENVVGGRETSKESSITTPPSVGCDESSSISTGSALNGTTTHYQPLLPIPITVKVELGSLDTKNKDRDAPPLSHLVLGLALQLATAIPFEILWDRFWTRRSFHVAEGLDIHMGDVIGCDEAKSEVEQICDFLQHPQKYKERGIAVPRGVLLFGPPGTGKTMLAKAVATEAGVPFLYVGGSEFNGNYAGIGVKLMKKLFRVARGLKRCLVFIDEIDYVGKRRGGGTNGLELDRESTLTQLLTEMDGFQLKSEVVVMATTNRLDLLDEALMRSGRFDLHVKLDPPDIQAREYLFKHYLQRVNVSDVRVECFEKAGRGEPGDKTKRRSDEVQVRVPPDIPLQPSLKPHAFPQSGIKSEPEKKRRPPFIFVRNVVRVAFPPLDAIIWLLKLPFVGWEQQSTLVAEKVELSELHCALAKQMAGLTAGCTGADVRNIVNIGQLISARANETVVSIDHLSDALDRITFGLVKKSPIMKEEERQCTAIHESGHAFAAWILPLGDVVNKISIVCRGSHLGFTQMLPNERHNSYRQQILDSVCVSLAGRAAEEVLLGDVTDGAISDLHHASEILMDMVTKLGFGSSIGLFSPGDNYKFSTSAAGQIEKEVKMLLDEQYERALSIVRDGRAQIQCMVTKLLEKEIVYQDEIESMWGPKVSREPSSIVTQ